jgi:ribonuclease HI
LESFGSGGCDFTRYKSGSLGLVILKEILRSPKRKYLVLGQLGLQETILVAAWYIWWQRHEAIKGECVAFPVSLAFSIHSLNINYGSVSSKVVPREIGWSKPPPCHYKFNVDAAFFPHGGGVVAAVIRDSKGEAIVGGAHPITNITDVTTAEASALRYGLQVLETIGCTPVSMESDSLELVKACNREIDLWSPYTAILSDCFQIAQRIGLVSFLHYPREANKAAHNLARLSYNSNSSFLWDGDHPQSVLSDILDHVSLLNSK